MHDVTNDGISSRKTTAATVEGWRMFIRRWVVRSLMSVLFCCVAASYGKPPKSPVPAAGSGGTAGARTVAPGAAEDFAKLPAIFEGIRRASSLTLYEGLPHQMFEAEALKAELAKKKTVKIHDYPFYERPLPIGAGEAESLRMVSAVVGSYTQYGGAKGCGGYHPDYCLAWKDGNVTYHLLICLGCHEMKLFGPKAEALVDINGEAYRTFKALLNKRRSQRPEPAKEGRGDTGIPGSSPP